MIRVEIEKSTLDMLRQAAGLGGFTSTWVPTSGTRGTIELEEDTLALLKERFPLLSIEDAIIRALIRGVLS